MAWDLIGELRQLANDIVTVCPQANAIKGKHPAILDAAARRLQELEDEVKELRHDAADRLAFGDLAASGGIVDAP